MFIEARKVADDDAPVIWIRRDAIVGLAESAREGRYIAHALFALGTESRQFYISTEDAENMLPYRKNPRDDDDGE